MNVGKIIQKVGKGAKPILVTSEGEPAVFLVNYSDFQGMLHSLDEMQYPDHIDRLAEAMRDSKKRKGISLEKLKDKMKKRNICG